MILPHLSVSQVTQFRRCKRKWFWRYIEKVKFPPSAAMKRGIDIHNGIERWLKYGKPVESHLAWTQPYVDAIKPHFPQPKSREYFVEQFFEIATPTGIPKFIGYIDFLSLDPANVRDTKTTSNLRYMKTPEELAENEQLNVYAKWAYQEDYRGPIEVGHVYVEVRQPAPKKVLPRSEYVHTELNQKGVEEVWQGIIETAADMQKIALMHKSALDCEPNTEACNDYGGCEYRDRCGIIELPITGSFVNKASKKKEESFVPMSKFKELLAAKKAAKENGGEAATTKTEAAEAKAAPKAAPGLKSAPWAKKQQAAVAPETAEEEAEGLPEGIEPPDAAPRAQETAEAAEEQAPKKRKGRPKKSESSKAANNSGSGGFRLYVDCFPSKGVGEYTLYEDWIGPVEETCNELAQNHPESPRPDFRMLPYHEPKLLFRQVLQEALKTSAPDVLVMSSSVSFSGEALSVLIPHASEVVRAW